MFYWWGPDTSPLGIEWGGGGCGYTVRERGRLEGSGSISSRRVDISRVQLSRCDGAIDQSYSRRWECAGGDPPQRALMCAVPYLDKC